MAIHDLMCNDSEVAKEGSTEIVDDCSFSRPEFGQNASEFARAAMVGSGLSSAVGVTVHSPVNEVPDLGGRGWKVEGRPRLTRRYRANMVVTDGLLANN